MRDSTYDIIRTAVMVDDTVPQAQRRQILCVCRPLRLVSPLQAARIVGRDRRTIYRWIAEKKLTVKQTGRLVLLNEDELLQLKESA